MEDYIAQVHAQKRKKTVIGIAVAAVVAAVLMWIFIRPSDGARKLEESVALSRAPALALTVEELALAETILGHDAFRNALNYDLVENVTLFSVEETWGIINPVIPENADVTEVSVAGAVVIIDYRLPQHRIILEYLDADRSGTVDTIRKSLAPMIDGVTTGCYQVCHNLSTGKIEYTYIKF